MIIIATSEINQTIKDEVFMRVKKMGKGKIDPANGLWCLEAKPERFIMNQRLVEKSPEVKALRSEYSRHTGKKPPSKRHPAEREEYFEHQKNLKKEIQKLLVQVYEEIFQESFSYPVPLRKDRDYDHNKSDWRYCLYQGIIYQFDRPDYGDDEMIRQINELQSRTLNSQNTG